jgi:hypothetical protein
LGEFLHQVTVAVTDFDHGSAVQGQAAAAGDFQLHRHRIARFIETWLEGIMDDWTERVDSASDYSNLICKPQYMKA